MTGFDTGGINWTVRVQDEFTAPLNQFQRLVDQTNQSILQARGNQAMFQNVRNGARATAPALQGMTNQLNAFRAALNSGTAQGNRLVFTLRNIIGVGAGLAAIQNVQGAFRGLVEEGISFNKQLEDSRVGIAGLLNAVGEVRDAQGELVTGARAFNFTEGIAVSQVEKLRQATLRTTASFQQLADTFQVAVAPGLRAGLDVDQIRELAISVSQAAGALSVPTNQLSEEIRALLTGTIQARTTRIATALGITPDDIRKARQQVGGLARFLEQRFAAFRIAADRVAGTFTGTFRRAQTAISLSAGQASKTLFEELRQTFEEVFEQFTQRDPFGNIIPNARAARVLREVFDGIATAIRTIRENTTKISFAEVLSAAQGLGSFFAGLGQVITGFITGAIQVVSELSRVFRSLTQGTDFIQLFTVLGRIITLVGIIGTAFGTVSVIISTLILPLRTLNTVISTVTATSRLLTNPWTLLLGVIAAVVVAAEKYVSIKKEISEAEKIAAGLSGDLSKEAKTRQQLTDALKEQKELLEEIGTTEDANNAGAEQRNVRRFEAAKRVHDLELDLELLRRRRIANPEDPTLQPGTVKPVVDSKSLLDQAADFAKTIVDTIQGTLDKNPVRVNLDRADKDLKKASETFDPGEFLSAIEEAEKRLNDLQFKGREQQINKFEEALKKMADMTEQGVSLMQSTISAFGNFIADTIVDAFDPSNDVSFKERFARFLQGIAKQIIATLVQIAIAKAVLQIGFADGGGLITAAKGGLVQAFDKGGPVRGGIPRPAGVPASDTVPAWLTPGEFVQKASAVARYGADAMDALNRGLIDRMEFRSLAGLGNNSGRSFTRAKKIAFADGGIVGQAASVPVTQGVPAASGPSPAFIVGNDAAVDRFLRGGKAAFLDFMRENASSVKAIVGQ